MTDDTPPVPPAQSNEALLRSWDERAAALAADVREARVQDEFEGALARVRERCGEAMARYVEAVHRNAPLAEKERLWAEVIRT